MSKLVISHRNKIDVMFFAANHNDVSFILYPLADKAQTAPRSLTLVRRCTPLPGAVDDGGVVLWLRVED